MYEGHFQLQRRPFSATPDPHCCYLSPAQEPLLQSVARCIDHGQGLAILTGPAGIGKTLLAQVLLAESESRFTGVYLGTGQFPTRRALLQAVLYELGQPYGGMTDQELRLELNTALRNLITQKDGLLLILDEAHLLSDRLLEEVRLIADLAQHGVPLTRVVLSGNPEFEERLTSSTLAAFNQRVACHVVLETLTRLESISYLEYRIQWAGGIAERIFDREALQLIADASDGIPRCLNQLADHSLMQAFLAGHKTVTTELVRRTLADLQHLPLRWNPSALHERTVRKASVIATADHENEPLTSADSVVEVGEQTDDSSCCFEFGAGDGEAGALTTSFESSSPTLESTPPALPVVDRVEFDSIEFLETEQSSDIEDLDGPPLFAWLAKPAEETSTLNDDDYATSSFTIPARPRHRQQVVEHEIVGTDPLSGPELLAKRRPETQRVTTTIKPQQFLYSELPAEEIIVDQYAVLDSRLTPMFPQPAVQFPIVSVPSNRTTAAPELTDLEGPAAAIASERAASVIETTDRIRIDAANGPLERIDAILALFEQFEGPVQGNGGVELITEYGVERIDVDLPSGTTTEHHHSFDIEDLIGSTVVEVGRDVQQSMAKAIPEPQNRVRATRIDQLLDSIQRETHYDIVEPDPAQSSSHQSGPAISDAHASTTDHAGVVPPPNHGYKNFFSVLRRRQIR